MKTTTTYRISSSKGSKVVEGSYSDAVIAALALERELQPAFGVTIENEAGETAGEIRDGQFDE